MLTLKREVYVSVYPKWLGDLLQLLQLLPSFFDCFLLMLPIIRIFVLNNGMKWRVESFFGIDI